MEFLIIWLFCFFTLSDENHNMQHMQPPGVSNCDPRRLRFATPLPMKHLSDVKDGTIYGGCSIHCVAFKNTCLSVPLLWPLEVV